MKIVWAVLLIAFIWVEASTVGLVSVWFAAGSLAAGIASLLGAEIWLQVVLFFCVSGVLLLLLRPMAKKHFTPKLTKTNADAVIGTTGKVLKRIENDAAEGQVKLGAMEWTARSTSGDVIEEGTLVRVNRIEGVKVYVSPVETPVKI